MSNYLAWKVFICHNNAIVTSVLYLHVYVNQDMYLNQVCSWFLTIAFLLEAGLCVSTPKEAFKNYHNLYYVIVYVPMSVEGRSG